jgi:DNA-binding NarL/FixJ family response regulator
VESPESTTPTALVVAGDEETRVLLRGLLRLHHCRVVGEAEGMSQALDMIAAHHPQILVADAVLAEGSLEAFLRSVGALTSRPRTIVVTPPDRDMPETPRPDAILHRPFRIREFAQALGDHAPPAIT